MLNEDKRLMLQDMLSYRRPAYTKTERKFITKYIDSVPGMTRDAFGNRILRIGNGTTMISCHTDTVHTEGGKQCVLYDERRQEFTVAPIVVKNPARRFNERFESVVHGMKTTWKPKRSPTRFFKECLGADDGAGVFAALQMIECAVPALYVFHRGEEIGGQGSDWIVENTPELVEGIERCIALDRRGQTDIITRQMVGRCCSDDFANAFAKALDMRHSACPHGSFTDSANYIDLIPECTNVSIGYHCEHSVKESLDWDYLQDIIDRLCTIDLDLLPTVRVKGTKDLYQNRGYTTYTPTTYVPYTGNVLSHISKTDQEWWNEHFPPEERDKYKRVYTSGTPAPASLDTNIRISSSSTPRGGDMTHGGETMSLAPGVIPPEFNTTMDDARAARAYLDQFLDKDAVDNADTSEATHKTLRHALRLCAAARGAVLEEEDLEVIEVELEDDDDTIICDMCGGKIAVCPCGDMFGYRNVPEPSVDSDGNTIDNADEFTENMMLRPTD